MSAEIRVLHEMGCSNAEIALHLGITEGDVSEALDGLVSIDDDGAEEYARASVAQARRDGRIADLIPNADELRKLYGKP